VERVKGEWARGEWAIIDCLKVQGFKGFKSSKVQRVQGFKGFKSSKTGYCMVAAEGG